MPRYKKCPRCDLNYILEEEQYCKICQEELRGISHQDEDLEDEIEETEEGRLCPRCHINFLAEGETICSCCRAEQAEEKGEELRPQLDEMEPDEWEAETTEENNMDAPADDDVTDDELNLSLEELQDEEGEEDEEDEEDEYKGKDKDKKDDDDFDFDGNIDDIPDEEEEEKSDDDDDLL